MPRSKPSYKSMIITAISSHSNARRGVSYQLIANYLQENFTVSSGGRFNSALRRALQSGITSGIFQFGDSEQRYKLTKPQKQSKSGRQKRRQIVVKKPLYDAVLHQTRSATKHDELFKLVAKSLSLPELKRMICAKINCMDSEQVRNVHHHCLSIHAVLPDDVMQNILSFAKEELHGIRSRHIRYDGFIQQRLVCQKWNRLIINNEKNALRAMYQSVMDRNPDWSLNDNNTWIMHATRRRLHPIEQQLGLRRVLRNFEDIDRNCRNVANCRVLIHPGDYSRGSNSFESNQNIHFVGLSKNKPVRAPEQFTVAGASIVTLEDVYFAASTRGYFIQEKSKMTVKNCRCLLGHGSSFQVARNARLEMHHCHLESSCLPNHRGGKTAICISPWADEVHVSNNTFNGFYHSVAVLHDRVESATLAMIKMKNNTFMFDKWRDELVEQMCGGRESGWDIHGRGKQVVELLRNFNGNVITQQPQIQGTGRCLLANNKYCTEYLPESLDPSDANTMKLCTHTDRKMDYMWSS